MLSGLLQSGTTKSDLFVQETSGAASSYRVDFLDASDGLDGYVSVEVDPGLARDTARIRLGTLMTSATFRHPGVLAISVAGVDQMSGGRVELGLGAGGFEAEHAAYGIPFPGTRERFDRLEETFAVLHGLMTEEAMPTLDMPGVDLGAYRDQLLERFRNPALKHRTWQIAMDGSQKLPQRLLGTIRDRLKAGQGIERLATHRPTVGL